MAQLTVAHGLQRAAGWRAAPPTGARGVGAGLAGTARPRNSIIFGGSSPARGPCRGGSNLPAGRVGGVDGRPEKATRLRLFTPLSIILTQAFSVVSYWLSISTAFIIVRRLLGLVSSACRPEARNFG